MKLSDISVYLDSVIKGPTKLRGARNGVQLTSGDRTVHIPYNADLRVEEKDKHWWLFINVPAPGNDVRIIALMFGSREGADMLRRRIACRLRCNGRGILQMVRDLTIILAAIWFMMSLASLSMALSNADNAPTAAARDAGIPGSFTVP